MRIDWREQLQVAIDEAGHTQAKAAHEMSGHCPDGVRISKNTVASWLNDPTARPSWERWPGIEAYIQNHTDFDGFDMREALNG